MKPKTIKCCICRSAMLETYSNNAWPLANGRCCSQCNDLVILARLGRLKHLPRAARANKEN